MDRSQVKNIVKDAEEALKAVADKYGLVVDYKGARFGSTSATVKFDFTEVGDDGLADSPGRNALKLYYPELVDAAVRTGARTTAKVIEYHSRKRSYPFIVVTENGARYKMSESDVRNQLVK